MPLIVVTTKFDEEFLHNIGKETGMLVRNKSLSDLTSEDKKEVEIVLSYGNYNDVITSEDIAMLPKLKWIHLLSSGTDQLPLKEIRDYNIILTTVRGIHGIPISEYVFTILLYFTKRIPYYNQAKKNKQWSIQVTDEIYGKTIGILGTGMIGKEIARKAKAFGMIPYGINRSGQQSEEFQETYQMSELEKVIGTFDVIVAALPSNEGTIRIVDEELIDKMKNNIIFINVGRGDLIVEKDLQSAILDGKFQGVGLDVFNEEPLTENSQLWELDNLIITPHMAASTKMYIPRALTLFFEDFSKYQQNQLY